MGPRQVRADPRPVAPSGGGFPQHVGGEIERVRVERREEHRLRPDDPVVGALQGRRSDLLLLPRATVPARDLAAVDDVRVERVRRGIAVLLDACRVPVAEGDRSVRPARRDAGRSAFLLSAAEPIGEGVVGRDVEHLRGRLVVPAAPRSAAVDRDDRALIGRDQDRARARGIDPDAVVVVAARRAAEGQEGLAAIGRLPHRHAGGEDRLGVLRVDLHFGEVVGPLDHPLVLADARPALARVVGTIEKRCLFRLDRGEEPRGA